MFQIVTMWNMARPDLEMRENIADIRLRGYNSDPDAKVFLTGEFATKISSGEIKSLSVGDISSRQCPSRRDLYYKKGVNRPKGAGIETWGKIAGRIAERYIVDFFSGRINRGNSNTYQGLRRITSKYSTTFKSNNQSDFDKLGKLKTKDYEDPDWLIKILSSNGRAELGVKILHSAMFNKKKDTGFESLRLNTSNSLQLRPKPREMGISSGVEPDFLLEEYKIVGDIKSGTKFEDYYPLTCAGYALAYENERRENNDMNWGIIYFIPTRHPTDYVRPITCAQIYIFPIDDNLRRWFLEVRNQDYSIISKSSAPGLPGAKERRHCPYCTFREKCEDDGLEI